MTLDEFRNKWRYRMAGAMLYGTWTESTQGQMQRAAHALEIPKRAEEFLTAMYHDIYPRDENGHDKPTAVAPIGNQGGSTQPQANKTAQSKPRQGGMGPTDVAAPANGPGKNTA